MKYLEDREIRTVWDETIAVTERDGKPTGDNLTLSFALRILVNNLGTLLGQKVSFHDEDNAFEVARAVRGVKDGILAIEEQPYRWALDLIKEHGAKIYSPNTKIIYDMLKDGARNAPPGPTPENGVAHMAIPDEKVAAGS